MKLWKVPYSLISLQLSNRVGGLVRNKWINLGLKALSKYGVMVISIGMRECVKTQRQPTQSRKESMLKYLLKGRQPFKH